jgi:hypothetical protein
MSLPARYPEVHKYITSHMQKADFKTIIELLRKVQTQVEMGHDFFGLSSMVKVFQRYRTPRP